MTFFLQISKLLVAITFQQIEQVVAFLGIFGSSYQLFLFPGLIYLRAYKLYGPTRAPDCETRTYQIMACIYIFLFFVFIGLYSYGTIVSEEDDATMMEIFR